MTLPNRGVDLLLRRATADLRPDIDQLVAGGLARGRTRQRRARIGTAVATVAVFGVIGAGAAVVPHLGSGLDSDRDPVQPATSTSSSPAPSPELTEGQVFPDGRDAAVDMTEEQSLWTEDADNAPDVSVLRPLVTEAQMRTELEALTGGVVRPPIDGTPVASSEDQTRQFHVTVEGALVTFMIRMYNPAAFSQDESVASLGPGYICRDAVPALPDCAQQDDGSWIQRADSYSAGDVATARNEVRRDLVLTTTDGWQIDVAAYNVTAEKAGDVVAAEPVMKLAELEMIATNPGWYA